jgi:hypothetical protein
MADDRERRALAREAAGHILAESTRFDRVVLTALKHRDAIWVETIRSGPATIREANA